MAEYIKKEDVFKAYKDWLSTYDIGFDCAHDLWIKLDELLVPDVVEVVRCKDCIHRPSRIQGAEDECEGLNLEFSDDWCPMQCEDGWYNRMPRDDYFCAYGEET